MIPAASAYDDAVLARLRRGLALAERPFAVLAADVGACEQEVVADVRRLLTSGRFDGLAPVFPAAAFGLRPTTVAASVPGGAEWRAERILTQHPGVSHVTFRDHTFAVWFSIAIDPASRLGLAGTLRVLGDELAARAIHPLPARRVIIAGGRPWPVVPTPAKDGRRPFDRAVVLALQAGVPVDERPFARGAAMLGTSERALVEHLRDMRRRRMLLRVGAVGARSPRAGDRAVLALRDADEAAADRVVALPAVAAVTHRVGCTGFPYSTHVSLTAPDGAIEDTAAEVERASRAAGSILLRARRTVKLRRLLFAPEEHELWEDLHARGLVSTDRSPGG
ncbi:hypothetical protein LRS13_13625 [Svornostia abyssi]|uniref:Siroheme decarboxylase NirL-like HTH domain-containing protein n=1 Tax=Svornostia abyssi TaxID=2898438 RepID=A0ABY5PAY6_9ACTN|nr:hypothetical protein LRS13_13625 [Parviterribacteraceae bacterium J379]